MNKLDWFLVGCFIAGGLFLFSGLVIAALYGSYSDYDGAPMGFQQGASLVLFLVGLLIWIIGYLTLMLGQPYLPQYFNSKKG